MDFFHGQDYQTAYSWGDFPIETPYRERLFFEVSITTLDQSLEVMAANCCSTPTADHNKEHRFRHELIHEGYVVFRSTKCPIQQQLYCMGVKRKKVNRPYSYSRWWTGASFQWRLTRGDIIKKRSMSFAFATTSCICLSCKLVPVQYRESGVANRVCSFSAS